MGRNHARPSKSTVLQAATMCLLRPSIIRTERGNPACACSPVRAELLRPRANGRHAAAVTFIVTLAASGIVTLAARAAGMSRKSAYALESPRSGLRGRLDRGAEARSTARRQGDKVEEVDAPPVSSGQGDSARRGAVRESSGAARRRAPANRRRPAQSVACQARRLALRHRAGDVSESFGRHSSPVFWSRVNFFAWLATRDDSKIHPEGSTRCCFGGRLGHEHRFHPA